MRRSITFPLLLLLALTGCELSDEEKILGIDASGSLAGLVFLDADGDQLLDPAVDGPVARAGVSLLISGSPRVLLRTETSAGGEYWFPSIPVGSYRVVLDSTALGDTLRMLNAAPVHVVVSAGDTAVVLLGVGRPLLAVAELRRAESGRRVTLEGIALSGSGTFGDGTLHVADSTGSIRAFQLRDRNVSAGDSLRLVGVSGRMDGEPALLEAEVFFIGRGSLPPATPLATGAAARASGGSLDAAQVRIEDAVVLSTGTTVQGDLRLRVDDGSGLLDVVLDRHAGITSEIPVLPGARVDAVGVLVPDGEGKWQLKPRASRDLVIRVPRVDAVELRRLAPGRFVSLEGVALNGWATFNDATLHLADRTGAALAVRVPDAFVFTGDSVRVLGIVGVFNGRPALVALNGVAPTLLGRGEVPAPVEVTTARAADADGARLGAALVRVRGTVSDTARAGADVILTLNDGTGPLPVVLSAAVGLSSAVHAPGTTLEVTGLLVPEAGGRSWALRPRTREDLRE